MEFRRVLFRSWRAPVHAGAALLQSFLDGRPQCGYRVDTRVGVLGHRCLCAGAGSGTRGHDLGPLLRSRLRHGRRGRGFPGQVSGPERHLLRLPGLRIPAGHRPADRASAESGSAQSMTIRITASRHTAFYTPLISTMAAGFLERHGLQYEYNVLAPGETAAGLIRDGKVDVMQSAPSTNWARMDKGETGFPLHFALINQRDGFFLVGRDLIGESFNWKELEGKTLLADHGSQPLAMLRYAIHYNGVD